MVITISRQTVKLASPSTIGVYLNKKPVAEIANHQTIELALTDSQAVLALNFLNITRTRVTDGDHILIKTNPYWIVSYLLAILAFIPLFLSLFAFLNPIYPYAQIIWCSLFFLSCFIPRHRLLKESS